MDFAKSLKGICQRGDFELLKKLYLKGKIIRNDVVRVDECELTLFECASLYGHLQICKWLYYTFEITKEDAMLNDYCSFNVSCLHGQLNVCKWMQKKFRFTKEEIISISDGGLLEDICEQFICEENYPESFFEIFSYLSNTFGFTTEDVTHFIHKIPQTRRERFLECFTPIGLLTKPAKF
jgi:hypothetical protein